jgi:hypothetical protein
MRRPTSRVLCAPARAHADSLVFHGYALRKHVHVQGGCAPAAVATGDARRRLPWPGRSAPLALWALYRVANATPVDLATQPHPPPTPPPPPPHSAACSHVSSETNASAMFCVWVLVRALCRWATSVQSSLPSCACFSGSSVCATRPLRPPSTGTTSCKRECFGPYHPPCTSRLAPPALSHAHIRTHMHTQHALSHTRTHNTLTHTHTRAHHALAHSHDTPTA